MFTKSDISKFQDELKNKTPQEILKWAYAKFDNSKIALATSLGYEDQVLTDMIVKINPAAQIFTLDTGRIFQDTYNTIDATMMKYKIKIEMLFPEKSEVEAMVKDKGPNLFYDSIENRKLCCKIRKINSLQKKLSTLDIWITGLRREQSVTRTDLSVIALDEVNGLIKLNPLIDWSETQTLDYIKSNSVPYNKLHDKGFPSIGCEPCTRAVKPGEDVRAGRWWWENPDSKECGLHKK